MADDEWQVDAVHQQFDVFEALRSPYEKIEAANLHRLHLIVNRIWENHMRMVRTSNSPHGVAIEILKHADREEIKLSFVVIVTNIKYEGKFLSQMPIFVMVQTNKKLFIDMNLSVFDSWQQFVNQNGLPPCEYCFPVEGQYVFGGDLKIDFTSSPAARQNENLFWRTLAVLGAGVGIVVGSFFYAMRPIDYKRANCLIDLANEFLPGIRKYGSMFLSAVTIVQKLKSGDLTTVTELWRLMTRIHSEFKNEISVIVSKVKNVLWELYMWIRRKIPFFETASQEAQHRFLAVIHQEDSEISSVDLEAEEILEDSRKRNLTSHSTAVENAIHCGGDHGYARTIFKDAKNESALTNDKTLNPATLDLLEISSSLAKNSLKEVQDNFEALSTIVKEEYRKKIDNYSKMLKAASAGAGHSIDIKVYNLSLGIKGDPKTFYWKEAIADLMNSKLMSYLVKEKCESIQKQKKILMLPLPNNPEDQGLFRLVGVEGAGKFSANELINAWEETQPCLNRRDMKVRSMVSGRITIWTEDLTIAAVQQLNSDNTSIGMLVAVKTEV